MFEFDTKKRLSNKEKHGIDFETAIQLWKDPQRVEIKAKWLDEPRYLLIAVIKNQHWSAIFTSRRKRIRLISVRRSRKNEKEIDNSFRI